MLRSRLASTGFAVFLLAGGCVGAIGGSEGTGNPISGDPASGGGAGPSTGTGSVPGGAGAKDAPGVR